MKKKNEMLDYSRRVSLIIDKIDDKSFEIAKQIFQLNFQHAKMLFLQIDKDLDEIIAYAQSHNDYYDKKIFLNIQEMNRCLNDIVVAFERNDFQNVSDILLYDFSNILNSYNDELKQIIDELSCRKDRQ